MNGLVKDTPASALAVYAHPDDPDISCGGTLAKWSLAGSVVHVVICAAGDKGSSDPAADPAVISARRSEEARSAAEILGVDRLIELGRRDGEFENDAELRSMLVSLIREIRPAVVICPDPTAIFFGAHHYNHRDHRIVGWATLDSVAPAAASPLYFPGAGPPHQVSTVLLSGSLEPNAWVDISATLDAKVRAVSCHESQLIDANDWFASALRDGAEQAGSRAGVSFAEAFRRVWLE
jgi:LmbE family N-acetylglucosaminyl deacetylase